MYTITFKNGTSCIGYYRESNGGHYEDEQGFELNGELITWVEKV